MGNLYKSTLFEKFNMIWNKKMITFGRSIKYPNYIVDHYPVTLLLYHHYMIYIKPNIIKILNVIIRIFKTKFLIKINASLIKRIFSIILQALIISLIYREIPVILNIDTYLNITEKISLYFGLLEHKFTISSCSFPDAARGASSASSIVLGITSTRRLLFGFFLVNFLLASLLFFLVPLLFIVDNILFIILSILGMVLVKAFMQNFFKKHFIFTGFNKNKHGNIVNYVWTIIMNPKIMYFFFKLWIISIMMAILVRSPIFAMLPLDNDSIIGHALAVTLPLPIFLYLLNFVIKYLKKEEIKAEDYYFYNDFVVTKVNIYRILYIICINYIVRHYYSTYIMIILFLVTGVIFIFIYKLCRIPSALPKEGTLQLQSKFEPELLIVPLLSISTLLQQACNEGFMEYYSKSGNDRYIGWRKLPFSRPGIVVQKNTVNFLENKRKNNVLYEDPTAGIGENMINNCKLEIEKSPILNMAYRVKNNFATTKYQMHKPWHIRPINIFYNNEYSGFVSLALNKLNGRFLIVCIIRKDLPGVTFFPSYYMPDDTDGNDARITEAVDLLDYKYGINMPKESGVRKTPIRSNGLIIYTQGESVNDSGLFKVWRPSIYFTKPQVRHPTLVDYYGLKRDNVAYRLNMFNLSNQIDTIKQSVRINIVKDEESFVPLDQEAMRKLAFHEYIADRSVRFLVLRYIKNGLYFTKNPQLYWLIKSTPNDPSLKYTFRELLYKVDVNVHRARNYSEFTGKDKDFDDTYKRLMQGHRRLISNNEEYLLTRAIGLKTRRDYSIRYNLAIFTPARYTAFFNIYKQGVIEGFKVKAHRIGGPQCTMRLPLYDSRLDCLKYVCRDDDRPPHKRPQGVYVVSINRLNFEFFEIKPFEKRWGSIFGAKESLGIDNEGGEVYSLVDLSNVTRMPLYFKDRVDDFTLANYDFNLFDNKDEHSIRKAMDYIYRDNPRLLYRSDLDNSPENASDPTVIRVKNMPKSQIPVKEPKSGSKGKKVRWADLVVRTISNKRPVNLETIIEHYDIYCPDNPNGKYMAYYLVRGKHKGDKYVALAHRHIAHKYIFCSHNPRGKCVIIPRQINSKYFYHKEKNPHGMFVVPENKEWKVFYRMVDKHVKRGDELVVVPNGKMLVLVEEVRLKGKEVVRNSRSFNKKLLDKGLTKARISYENSREDDDDMVLAKLASLASLNKKNTMVQEAPRRGLLDTLLDHTHAKDAAMAGPSKWRKVYFAENIITIPDDARENIITIPDDARENIITIPEDAGENIITIPEDAGENIITRPDNTVTDNVIMISSDESSVTSEEDYQSLPNNNLESSVVNTGVAERDLAEEDLGGYLGLDSPDSSRGSVDRDLPRDRSVDRELSRDLPRDRSVYRELSRNSSVDNVDLSRDKRVDNRDLSLGVDDNGLNILPDTSMDISENAPDRRENEPVTWWPVHLYKDRYVDDKDTCVEDINSEGILWPVSPGDTVDTPKYNISTPPNNVNTYEYGVSPSQDSINTYQNNDNLDREGDTPMDSVGVSNNLERDTPTDSMDIYNLDFLQDQWVNEVDPEYYTLGSWSPNQDEFHKDDSNLDGDTEM